jgi:diguanylate cyclase (GGDEF)-like protein
VRWSRRGPAYRSSRRAVLRDDVAQVTVGALLLMVPHLFFLRSDYLLFGFGPTFWLMVAVRLGAVMCTLLLVWSLRGLRDPSAFDRRVLAWSMAGVAVITVGNLTRSPTYTGHLTVDVLVMAIGYFLIPNRLVFRLIPAVTLAASLAGLYIGVKRVEDPLIWNVLWTALVLANVFGAVMSGRLYTLRRQQFLARHELEQARDDLHVLATTDPLTGLLNRRHFMQLADDELARARRYGRPLSIVAIDLDYFKDVNDRFGHASGDEVLRTFARALLGQTRRHDVVGRLGGEEFAVVLPETGRDAACELAERIRAALDGLDVRVDESPLRVTASLGIAEARPDDRALYRAKRAGRNRIEAA